MLYGETVTPELLDLIIKLMQDKKLNAFRLVGGTALSLQLGHRKSIDIDLFSDKTFNADSLQDHIAITYKPQDLQSAGNIVMARINGIKVDVIAHRYRWIGPAIELEGIRMASVIEIAAMKLNAINGLRPRQKDFADMYFLLEQFSLNAIATAYSNKYPQIIHSVAKESVRNYDLMVKGEEIKLVDPSIIWETIESRLNEAVMYPNKIFHSATQGIAPKKSHHKRKGNRPS